MGSGATGCVPLEKLLNLSVPNFTICKEEMIMV